MSRMKCKMGETSLVCVYKRNIKPELGTGCDYQSDCIYQIRTNLFKARRDAALEEEKIKMEV